MNDCSSQGITTVIVICLRIEGYRSLDGEVVNLESNALSMMLWCVY